MTVNIRSARQADGETVVSLVNGLLWELGGTPVEPTVALSAIKRLITNGLVLVAEDGGVIVGVCTLSQHDAIRTRGPHVVIEELYVVPTRRGDGVGAWLVEAAVRKAGDLGCDIVEVSSPRKGERQEAFYEREGFAPVGMRLRRKVNVVSLPTSDLGLSRSNDLGESRPTLSNTERTKLRRGSKRAKTDREDLYAVLDAGIVCHLGVIYDGAPMVVPTGFGRIADTLYLHGSVGARSLRTGGEVCVTVTHLDGIVLARSGLHSSVNYRSAMIYGTPRVVTDPDEKLAGLRALTEQFAPGQWNVMRPPTAKEVAATTVLALPLTEASVKVRTGPPEDDEADYALPIWAGVLPLRAEWGEPEPDPLMQPAREVPDHIAHRGRPFQTPSS